MQIVFFVWEMRVLLKMILGFARVPLQPFVTHAPGLTSVGVEMQRAPGNTILPPTGACQISLVWH